MSIPERIGDRMFPAFRKGRVRYQHDIPNKLLRACWLTGYFHCAAGDAGRGGAGAPPFFHRDCRSPATTAIPEPPENVPDGVMGHVARVTFRRAKALRTAREHARGRFSDGLSLFAPTSANGDSERRKAGLLHGDYTRGPAKTARPKNAMESFH